MAIAEVVHLAYPSARLEFVTHASQHHFEAFVAEDLRASDPETLIAWACEPVVSISGGPWGGMRYFDKAIRTMFPVAADYLRQDYRNYLDNAPSKYGFVGLRLKRFKD